MRPLRQADNWETALAEEIAAAVRRKVLRALELGQDVESAAVSAAAKAVADRGLGTPERTRERQRRETAMYLREYHELGGERPHATIVARRHVDPADPVAVGNLAQRIRNAARKEKRI